MKINENKKHELFRVTLLLIMLYILPVYKTQSDWCWTKSMANDPSYVFDPQKGGVNWAYCEKPNDKPETVGYEVAVETSKLPKSGTE